MAKQKSPPTMEELSAAYEATFSSASAAIVLRDLARFCRADETTFHPDARTHAVLEGRREAWLRINQFLTLTPAEITDLRMGRLHIVETKDD